MILTVASGKGGTGKTTLSTSLALTLAHQQEASNKDGHLLFLDCDVEEPNAGILLRPTLREEKRVGILTPQIDTNKCTSCGRCVEVCAWNALALVKDQILFFPELCHGCGSCALNCPEHAISESLTEIGTISWGAAETITFAQGTLDIGQAMATPVIRQLKEQFLRPLDTQEIAILDAPPGTSCPVVETLHGSDFVLLVTEPTPFGLHDLRLAYEVTHEVLGIPVGVAINRDGIGDDRVEAFCQEKHIPILMHIPMDRRIAEAISEGIPLVKALPEYYPDFVVLFERITDILRDQRSAP